MRKKFSGLYYASQDSVIRPGTYDADSAPAVFIPQKMTKEQIKRIASATGTQFKLTDKMWSDVDWGEVTFYFPQ